MSLPSGFLDELRARLTISEVIGRRVKLIRAGREFKACCPFHKEKSASFTVNYSKGFFHCFGCGAHGDVIGYVMRSENRSFMEAVETLASLANMQVPAATPEESQRYEKEKSLYTLIEDAARWFQEQLHGTGGRMALDYARSRKLSEDTIARFQLGFAPADGQALIKFLSGKGYKPDQMIEAGIAKKSDRDGSIYSFFRGRLIFPVGDRRGRVVAFGARLLEGEGPKYINSADHGLFHKGQLLYGFSRARAAAADGKPLIITEGYMDVIRLVEAGFMGAVAPLGTALTEEQIQLLWKIIPKPPVRPDLLNHIPILCFDGDTAGQRAAERALDRILPHIAADQSVRFAAMTGGDDPDSLLLNKGQSAMQSVLDGAVPLIDFLWQVTSTNRPMNTPEDRAGFRRDLEARVALIKDRALQQDYRDALQRRWQESYGAPPRPQAFEGGKREWRGKDGRPARPALPPMQVRPLPGNLQERIVLALLLNHPTLFPEMDEALHSLTFRDSRLEPLRHAIFDFMADHEENTGDLKNYLEKTGLGPVLSDILSEKTYTHAGFARAGRPYEMALAGWHDIWHHHMRMQLEEELKTASQELKSTNDPATLARMEQLQAMIIEMDSRAEEENLAV
jgi:DNA primase